jgi:hypothetical protein
LGGGLGGPITLPRLWGGGVGGGSAWCAPAGEQAAEKGLSAALRLSPSPPPHLLPCSAIVPALHSGSPAVAVGVALGAVLYSALVALTLWSYLACFLTPPGHVPPGWHPFQDAEARAEGWQMAQPLPNVAVATSHAWHDLPFRAICPPALTPPAGRGGGVRGVGAGGGRADGAAGVCLGGGGGACGGAPPALLPQVRRMEAAPLAPRQYERALRAAHGPLLHVRRGGQEGTGGKAR